MNTLLPAIFPELVLIVTACVLFIVGVSNKAASRRFAPVLALVALMFVFGYQCRQSAGDRAAITDPFNTIHVAKFAEYIKLLTAGIGVLLVLLAWPTNANATGNNALDFGHDAGEFFALMLASLAGIFLVAGANDIILLFLGIELASIPTYIMVSVSRPIPVAQEAGVKYFFLGAMAAAIMLFGFSYLYGTTGMINLDQIADKFADAGAMTPWQQLAIVMLVLGFCFKIAAVPLHFYAGDVYQGAATPVTAFLSYVPKTSGMVALIKILFVATGMSWIGSPMLIKLLWVLAAATMTVGNVLGLLQFNVKRVLAYSSIAHSGYMLVGLAALVAATDSPTRQSALEGVLFYLAAYGISNAAAFGVLMLLPATQGQVFGSDEIPPATSAETFEDLAGQGRRHPALGLAMAVTCFSLIGLPLTIGFFGKLLLIRPALNAQMYWLVIITVINAAISAGYYLRIVGTMFLRAEPEAATVGNVSRPVMGTPIVAAVCLSAAATLLFGTILPATQVLTNETAGATVIQGGRMSQSGMARNVTR
ncbi:MAG TPA: NADH-quinone oxidoreductase subunit N [Tepidisphaeraceae bacterium]|jgi:NADH-quinone oxidoreductase subunit N